MATFKLPPGVCAFVHSTGEYVPDGNGVVTLPNDPDVIHIAGLHGLLPYDEVLQEAASPATSMGTLAKDAIILISEMGTPEAITAFVAGETRSTIMAAADDRITELATGTPE